MSAWLTDFGQVAVALVTAESSANLFAQSQLFHHPLHAHERAHAGKQRDIVDWLGEKVIRTGLEAAQPVGDVA